MRKTAIVRFAGCVALAAVIDAPDPAIGSEQVAVPRVNDDRLELTLLASEPEIVTPTGMAADRHGRLYVVQSHTHSRPKHYDGPAHDRVIVFQDSDGDGSLDRRRIFADGLNKALAIAFSQDEVLYAVQMKSVVRLSDADGDGVCESQDAVLKVDTPNNNNHGVLLGLAFDNQNRMVASLGNIGGEPYSIQGSDGSVVAGQGDTGLIVRCGADGSSVERFAHGFWNPPELTFDSVGRLLATDNDPDSRGPNRVLHVIQGGDYGYKARFGGSGLHPYCAWNGELPGTLPMLAGVGEAPVGVLDCNATSLPESYQNDLLIGVWGTHEVVRVRTHQHGVTIRGVVEPLIVGDESFWPTSITAAADGVVYIADWADRRYPVHGKGRIWRLAAAPSVTRRLTPQAPFAAAGSEVGLAELRSIDDAKSSEDFELLIDAAASDDSYLASTAVSALAAPAFRERAVALLNDDSARNRLTALLTLRSAGVVLAADQLRALIVDDDRTIRKMTMIWAGETMRLDLARAIRESLASQAASADLFEVYLATSQLLTEEERERVDAKTPGSRIDRRFDQQLLFEVLADETVPTAAKAMAVRYVTDAEGGDRIGQLLSLARSEDAALAVEAIRTLAAAADDEFAPQLAAIAVGAESDTQVRCEAIMALADSETGDLAALLPLVGDDSPPIALTAARALTSHTAKAGVRDGLQSFLDANHDAALPDDLAEQLHFALQTGDQPRPQSDDQWKRALDQPGDAAAGGRIFFSRRTTCRTCHSVDGRGGRVGPDLSNIAAAKSSEQILSSVLQPSQDASPDFQGYVVLMSDGRVRQGTQFHFRGESAEMLLEDGRRFRFRLDDAEEYYPLDVSLMPDKLEEALSVSEFRDLMAFLHARGPVATAAGAR